jgi:hypothetical protein
MSDIELRTMTPACQAAIAGMAENPETIWITKDGIRIGAIVIMFRQEV